MKLKNVALNGLLYFLYMFGACFIVMLAEALLVSIIEKFVAIPYPILTILRIVVYSLGVTVMLAVAGYSEGYREGACFLGDTIVGGALALLPHLIFAMLFKFQAFVSGAVRFAAGLIHNGMTITYDRLINETPYSLFLLVFLGYGVLYVTVLTASKYLGAQKRIVDRADLRRGESDTAASADSASAF